MIKYKNVNGTNIASVSSNTKKLISFKIGSGRIVRADDKINCS